MELERIQDLPDNILDLLPDKPFLDISDSQDGKRPFYWGTLPKVLHDPHFKYYRLISNLRNFIKTELDIRSVQLTS